MSTKAMSKLTRRSYNISVRLIEDETTRNLIIDRFIDNANSLEFNNKSELNQKIFGDEGITDIARYQVINRIMSGWNTPLKYLVIASRAFSINMCHFLNADDSEYHTHPYKGYDEFEVLERNIRTALKYGGYSPAFMRRVKLITSGKYSAPFGVKYQKVETADTDYFTTEWFHNNFSVDGLVNLGKILNIPIHAFFNPNENIFRDYIENMVMHSYYRTHYSKGEDGKPSANASSRRREKALQIEPDHYNPDRGSHQSLPIYDEKIRNTIIQNTRYLMDLNGITSKAELARCIHATPYIASSVMEGRNTHVDYYFKLCDYFGVFFGDFINPEMETLHRVKGKNTNIDLRTILLNKCSEAHLNINDLDKLSTDDERFYNLKKSLLQLYYTINRSTKQSDNSNSRGYRTRTKNKYRILFNTLLDYCEIFQIDLVTLICNNTTLVREKAPIQKRMVSTVKLITIKDPDMAFICNTYQNLKQDQKDAIMTIFRYLNDKNTASNSDK